MHAVVSMTLYGYMDTNMINKGKRDEITKEILLTINM